MPTAARIQLWSGRAAAAHAIAVGDVAISARRSRKRGRSGATSLRMELSQVTGEVQGPVSGEQRYLQACGALKHWVSSGEEHVDREHTLGFGRHAELSKTLSKLLTS